MANRPKQIGTAVESAVQNVAREHGFPFAERIVLKGAADHGDVRLTPGLHVECKGGAMAEKASMGQIAAWLDECDKEMANANAFVVLVLKRKGVGHSNALRWRAFTRFRYVVEGLPYPASQEPVEMSLGTMLEWLQHVGYGTGLTHLPYGTVN